MPKKVPKKKRFTIEVEEPNVGKIDEVLYRSIVRQEFNRQVDVVTSEKFNPWLEELVESRK